VAARPGDETEKTDQVIEALTAAFIQGRLSMDEFGHRVGQALAAYAELKAIAADIPPAVPAVPSPVPSPESPEATREAYNKGLVARGTFVGAGAVMVAVFVVVTAVSGNPFVGFIAGGALGAVMVALLGVLLTMVSWALDSSSRAGPKPRKRPPRGRARRLGHNLVL
jgi:hypothetical protein